MKESYEKGMLARRVKRTDAKNYSLWKLSCKNDLFMHGEKQTEL